MKKAEIGLQEKVGETPQSQCLKQQRGPRVSGGRGAGTAGAAGSEAAATAGAAGSEATKTAGAAGSEAAKTAGAMAAAGASVGLKAAAGVGRAMPRRRGASVVGLLNDLCVQNHLPAVEYKLVRETGPAHLPQFTMRASMGPHSREYCATSKKLARQGAAELLYEYLRVNVVTVTSESVKKGSNVSGDGGASTAEATAAAGASQGASATGAVKKMAALKVEGAGAVAAAGAPVPQKAGTVPEKAAAGGESHATPSSVALLNELCEQTHLPPAEYKVVDQTGPAHLRVFKVRASVGSHWREASGPNKKMARQAAADLLYEYLCVNLVNVTAGLVQDDAQARLLDRWQRRRAAAPRPNLTQRVIEGPLGLQHQLDENHKQMAREALIVHGPPLTAAEAAPAVWAAAGLMVKWSLMANSLHELTVLDTNPPLSFGGITREEAASDSLVYLSEAVHMLPSVFPAPQ